MKAQFKKSTYIFALCFIGLLAILFHVQLSPPNDATHDHASLMLTPFTAREQKDLIQAQEQEERLDDTGSLVAQMSATDAQARVLNLNRAKNVN